MSLYFGMKLLSDVSLYYTFVSYICFFMGSTLIPLLPTLLLVLCGVSSYLLQGKSYRMLPVLLSLGTLLFASSLLEGIMLLLPILYVAFLCYKKLFAVDRGRIRDTFLISILLLPFLLIIGVLLFDVAILERYALPFVILYLGSSVLLLRMLRHDQETLLEHKFRLLNIGAIVFFCALGFAMSTGVFLNAVGDVIKSLYTILVLPFINLLVWLYGGLLWLLNLLFQFSPADPSENETPVGDVPDYGDVNTDPMNLDFLASLFIAIGILLGCVILYFILRLLLRKRRPLASTSEAGIIERREYIQVAERSLHGNRFAPRDPRQAIRFYYRKFLVLCKKRGLRITAFQNSQQIHKLASNEFDATLSAEFRRIYLPARYDEEANILKTEAEEMRMLYHKLKKE